MKARSNKELTIKAHKELIEKYLNPEGKIFFNPNYCPLCLIHRNDILKFGATNCQGCPLASSEGKQGCIEYESYRRAMEAHTALLIRAELNPSSPMKIPRYMTGVPDYIINRFYLAFQRRARFHAHIAEVLELYPKAQFTKQGWKYFNIPDVKMIKTI